MGAFTTGEGFAAIVPMHAPAMLRVATALIGPADAEDAVQEAAMRAWQAWATLRNPDAARPWLLQITINVCRDFLKKRQSDTSRFVQFGDDQEEVTQSIATESADAEQSVIQTQQHELIAKAMTSLPFKERASIVLRDVEGFSTEEVAQIMNSSATTVRSQISSARKKIRTYCQQHLHRFDEGGRNEL